jgi:hypothetical protein
VDGQPCWLDAEEMRAMLTPHGARVLRSAAPTHVRGVRDNLVDLLSPEERPVLTEVFERCTGTCASLLSVTSPIPTVSKPT